MHDFGAGNGCRCNDCSYVHSLVTLEDSDVAAPAPAPRRKAKPKPEAKRKPKPRAKAKPRKAPKKKTHLSATQLDNLFGNTSSEDDD